MFFTPQTDDYFILEGERSIPIVILSILIACSASYAALSMNQRIQQNSFFSKNFWLIFSSLSMGLGIWSMHFIGMSAFMLPVAMEYDLSETILSVLPAILASYLAFYVTDVSKKNHRLLASVIMGVGIATMHYAGMAAMKMEASFYYRPLLFIASVLIAIGVSYIALFIFAKGKKYLKSLVRRVLTAMVMGLAIASMHYTGMFAIVFYTEQPVEGHTAHMDMDFVILFVTIGISCLLLLSGLTNLLDKYVTYRLKYIDSLTIFPNQRQFELDISQLKEVNHLAIIHIHNLEKWITTHGYTLGDKVIKKVADSIRQSQPSSLRVYQIEQNRFAIVNVYQRESDQIEVLMEKVLSEFKRPLIVEDYKVSVDMVGVYSHATKQTSLKELFANCMAVLQHPSTTYDHQIISYNSELHQNSFENDIYLDIDRAIRDEELFLVYQPKINTINQKVGGLEALIRWNHPKHGMISPGIFIPILEREGSIFDVTDWVIEESFRQAAQFLKENIDFQQISINIPGVYVTSPRLLNQLKNCLEKYQIPSHTIQIEITETSVIHDLDNAIISVQHFRDLGFSVALDDFGTGLSSLSYLRKIPITTVKIDKSFVDEVPLSDKDSELLKAIISLCHTLHLNTVIEGVEEKGQVDFITSFVDNTFIQGYYYSRPLPSEEIKVWIEDWEKENSVLA